MAQSSRVPLRLRLVVACLAAALLAAQAGALKRLDPFQVEYARPRKGGVIVPGGPYSGPGKEPVFKATWVISEIVLNGDCQLARKTPVVQGNIPGPVLRVVEGTRVLITVKNRQKYPISIHWHGIVQRQTQWHDGVAGVTQCPIQQGQQMTYNFSTEGHSGSIWWHSHFLAIRHTVFGGLNIIPRKDTMNAFGRIPPPVPISGDATILLTDWYQASSEELEQGALGYPYAGWPPQDALFINGATRLPCRKMWEWVVNPNRWYFVRVTNGAQYATLNFAIQFHDIYTYESETGYLKPQRFQTYDIMSGQSYTFFMKTNQPPRAYWIGARGRYEVEGTLPGLAILRYKGAKGRPRGRGIYNGPTVERNPYLTHGQLLKTVGATAPEPWIHKPTKFVELQLNIHNVPIGKGKAVTRFSINNITMQLPKTWFPLMDEYKGRTNRLGLRVMPDMPPKGFWEYNQTKTSKIGFGIIDIPYGAVVHMVMQGHFPLGLNHPIHLHGYNYYVIGRGKGKYDMSKWNKYKYNLKNPVHRNTAWLLEGEWMAMRWKADNPGIWLMHCHLEPHVEGGMMAVFRVHTKDGVPPPPADMPQCPNRAKH